MPTSSAYVLTSDDVAILRRLVRAFKSGSLDRPMQGIRFVPPPSGVKIEVFELTASLSAGGSATADRLIWDGNSWEPVDASDPLPELTVYDATDSISGSSGDIGVAFFHGQSGLWVILQLACS